MSLAKKLARHGGISVQEGPAGQHVPDDGVSDVVVDHGGGHAVVQVHRRESGAFGPFPKRLFQSPEGFTWSFLPLPEAATLTPDALMKADRARNTQSPIGQILLGEEDAVNEAANVVFE